MERIINDFGKTLLEFVDENGEIRLEVLEEATEE